jgi:hypothetical protein
MNKVFVVTYTDDHGGERDSGVHNVYSSADKIEVKLDAWKDMWEEDSEGQRHWMGQRIYHVHQYNVL